MVVQREMNPAVSIGLFPVDIRVYMHVLSLVKSSFCMYFSITSFPAVMEDTSLEL